MPHLDEGLIHSWLDDALESVEAERVERHVASCERCAAAVAEARGLIAGTSRVLSTLDHVPLGGLPAGSNAVPVTARRGLARRWFGGPVIQMAIAASLLVVSLVAYHERSAKPETREPVAVISHQQPPVPAAVSPPAAVRRIPLSATPPTAAATAGPPEQPLDFARQKGQGVLADSTQRPSRLATVDSSAKMVAAITADAAAPVSPTSSAVRAFAAAGGAASGRGGASSGGMADVAVGSAVSPLGGAGGGGSRGGGGGGGGRAGAPLAFYIGCYAIPADLASRVDSTTLRIPTRFSLRADTVASGAVLNSIRTLDSTGVENGVVSGLLWRYIAGTASIATANGTVQSLMTIAPGPAGSFIATVPGEPAMVISRIPCTRLNSGG